MLPTAASAAMPPALTVHHLTHSGASAGTASGFFLSSDSAATPTVALKRRARADLVDDTGEVGGRTTVEKAPPLPLSFELQGQRGCVSTSVGANSALNPL